MKIFKLISIISTLFCLLICLFVIDPFFGVRYTVSESLPYKFFISRPCSHVVKNQYVAFEHPKSPVLVAKQVIGMAGDYISMQGDHLCINEQDYGHILEISQSGMHLHPTAEGQIPEGYVFVYGPHPESFDSRYQEFGLVKTEQLKETLWPLF